MSDAVFTRNSECGGMMGRVLDNEDPTSIPRSKNWSELNCKSFSNLDFSMNVKDAGKSITVMTLSTGQSRASLVE